MTFDTQTARRFPSIRPALRAACALALIATAVGCSKQPPVEDGKQVGILYEAKTIEGHVVDATPETGPLVFVVGAGKLLPKVEEKLVGMRVGDEKTFAIQDAYGVYDEGKTATLARNALPDDETVKVGASIEMVNGIPSKIKEIHDTHVVLDLNHPLAGQEIVFTVKIVEVGDPKSS